MVPKSILAAGVAVGALGALTFLPGESTQSADHLDPPARTDPDVDPTPDRAADIADVYAWSEGGNTNIAVTFAGPAPTDRPATYDRDVLYRVYLSTDGNALNTERVIEVRFGKDGTGNNGVRADGLPVVGTLVGPVETDLTQGAVKFRAGLFDDPFFFDLQGFKETRDTGTLQFDSERDFFANANATAFVMQFPTESLGASGAITVWADTRRFGGQL